MTLPRNRRLKINESKYRQLRNKGERFDCKDLYAFVLTAGGNEETKFSIVVPKKLDKRAFRRNRTRRLLSSAVQKLLCETRKGCEVVIIAKKIYKKEKLHDILPVVESLLRKAGLVRIKDRAVESL